MNGRLAGATAKLQAAAGALLRAPEFLETNKKQHAGLDSSCYARHLETASPSGRAKPLAEWARAVPSASSKPDRVHAHRRFDRVETEHLPLFRAKRTVIRASSPSPPDYQYRAASRIRRTSRPRDRAGTGSRELPRPVRSTNRRATAARGSRRTTQAWYSFLAEAKSVTRRAFRGSGATLSARISP